MRTWVLVISVVLAMALLAGGCVPSLVLKTYIKPKTQFYQRVAVMPFKNLTTDRFAHEIIQSMFINELLRTGLLEVSDPAQVESALAKTGQPSEAEIDLSRAQELGQSLGAGAIVLGSVGEYQIARRGVESIPEVEISVRMLDASTGEIIWAASVTYQGTSVLLGTVPAPSLSRAAQRALAKMVEPLKQELKIAASEGRIKAAPAAARKPVLEKEKVAPEKEVVTVREKPPALLLVPQGPPYMGIEECRTCHSDRYEKWMDSKHATAFQALLKTKQDTNSDCLPCHTTGYGQGGGFIDAETTPQMENVQCESCHGPGSEYTGDNMPEMFTLSAPTEEICLKCHTTEWSPGFDFQEGKQKIKHW